MGVVAEDTCTLPERMQPGQPFVRRWTVTNTGTSRWPDKARVSAGVLSESGCVLSESASVLSESASVQSESKDVPSDSAGVLSESASCDCTGIDILHMIFLMGL